MNADLRTVLRNFVFKKMKQKGDAKEFSDADSLFGSRRLDSLDAVDTVVFLEENFGIDFAKIGFDQVCIDSIDAMLELMASHSARS